MKLRVATLILAQLAGCARQEPPAALALSASPPVAVSPAPEPGPERQASTGGASPVEIGTALAPSAAASSLPAGPPPPLFVEPDVTNRAGLRGLVAALDDVDHVDLFHWEPAKKIEPLLPADKDHLLQLLRQGVLTNTSTVEHPPCPAAFLFYTRSHGTYALLLVGTSTLRLDAGRSDGKFQGAAARFNSSPPPEIATSRDDDWLWKFLQSRLGETLEKEYLSVPPMRGIQLPHKL